jgi:hypothetical protein
MFLPVSCKPPIYLGVLLLLLLLLRWCNTGVYVGAQIKGLHPHHARDNPLSPP